MQHYAAIVSLSTTGPSSNPGSFFATPLGNPVGLLAREACTESVHRKWDEATQRDQRKIRGCKSKRK
jgi:hypothetical protein